MSTLNLKNDSDYFIIGRILSPKGIGNLAHIVYNDEKFFNFFESKVALYDINYKPLIFEIFEHNIESRRIIAKIDGFPDRNSLEIMRNKDIYIKKDMIAPLETNEFFVKDLEGLTVLKQQTKEVCGTVLYYHEYRGGPLLELKIFLNNDPDIYETIMYPFNHNTFPEVDLEKRTITLNDIEVISV